MKYKMMTFAVGVLLFTGCVYEAPLTTEHTVAVDPALLGLWAGVPAGGDESKHDDRMMILKYSDTEYLIHYPVGGNDEAYYRGYPIKISGVSCVQLQIIGMDDGPIQEDEKTRFHVASYELEKDELEIKWLNTDVVDDELKTTDALKQSFLEYQGDKKLFVDPGMFRRIKK